MEKGSLKLLTYVPYYDVDKLILLIESIVFKFGSMN
jgi:hypothetical protein